MVNDGSWWLMMVNIYVYWLVVEPYPSEKYEMMEFVSWDDEIPNWIEKLTAMFHKAPSRYGQKIINKSRNLVKHHGRSCWCPWIYPLVNQHNYGKSPFLMGKSTISMAIFNSYVSLPEGTSFFQEQTRNLGSSQYHPRRTCHLSWKLTDHDDGSDDLGPISLVTTWGFINVY